MEAVNARLAWERRYAPVSPRPSSAEPFALWCVACGLPEPEAEVVGLVPGRKFRVDWLFRTARVVVEIDGGIWKKGASGHSSGAGILRDMEKANLLQLEGFIVLRFSPEQINNGYALPILRRVLV